MIGVGGTIEKDVPAVPKDMPPIPKEVPPVPKESLAQQSAAEAGAAEAELKPRNLDDAHVGTALDDGHVDVSGVKEVQKEKDDDAQSTNSSAYVMAM